MTSPPVAQAQDYITSDMLDEAIQQVNQQIQDLSENLQNKLDEVSRKSQEALDQEREAREDAIQRVQQQTDERLEQIDTKLDKLDDISATLSSMKGTFEGWSQSMQTATHAHQQNSQDIRETRHRVNAEITQIRSDVDLVTSVQSNQALDLKQVKTVIHGDAANPDGPDSLFGLVRALKQSIDDSTQAQHTLIADIRNKVDTNATAIAVMQTKNNLLKEWRESASKILSNKYVVAILLTLLGGLVFGAGRELLETFLSALNSYLNGG